jgi:lipopolysaccharide/colanic/teichoic acid biosynthesis glycosyltransferase
LIMTGPVILAAIAAIRWTDGQSAIFKQTREGYRGRPFTIYKLRTMIVDAEAQQDALRDQSHRDGPAFKITNDPRVTRVGNFLRKTCLDELPQLWNVLKGDMSLVGPRPLPWHESRACQHWHRRRLDVRPGMTCYWQVQKDSIESFDDWMRLDLRYVEQLGLVEDIRLIVKTIAVPVLGRGGH